MCTCKRHLRYNIFLNVHKIQERVWGDYTLQFGFVTENILLQINVTAHRCAGEHTFLYVFTLRVELITQ